MNLFEILNIYENTKMINKSKKKLEPTRILIEDIKNSIKK